MFLFDLFIIFHSRWLFFPKYFSRVISDEFGYIILNLTYLECPITAWKADRHIPHYHDNSQFRVASDAIIRKYNNIPMGADICGRCRGELTMHRNGYSDIVYVAYPCNPGTLTLHFQWTFPFLFFIFSDCHPSVCRVIPCVETILP